MEDRTLSGAPGGAELHLLGLQDSAATSKGKSNYTYLGSVDMAGAFGPVPHTLLLKSFEDRAVDSYTCRYLHTWPAARTFQIRLLWPRGCSLSGFRSITGACPTGGSSFSFLLADPYTPSSLRS